MTNLISLYDCLKQFAGECPHKTLFYDEETVCTAEDVYHQTVSVANQLARSGLKSGESVAVRMTRSLQTLIVFYAVQSLGAVLFPVDAHGRVSDFISRCDVKIYPSKIITNEDTSPDISARCGWVIRDTETGNETRLAFEEFKEDEKPIYNTKIDINAPALVIFTSGTTGKGKGVVLSQANCVSNLLNVHEAGCFKEDDLSIIGLPLHHVFGLMMAMHAMYSRFALFFPRITDLGYMAECIDRYQVTRLDTVPSVAYALAKFMQEKRGLYKMNTLKRGILAGAPASMEQQRFIEDTLGYRITPVYGMSECPAIAAANENVSRDKRMGSVGRSLVRNSIAILSADGSRLPAGEEGEICVKSPAVMLGYYGDKDATDSVIDGEGRLHTGDLGYMDREGFLHISGRIKDIIIRNGNNISGAKVEDALKDLPCVLNAAVVGLNHEVYGEAPYALVVLDEGCTVDAGKIREMLKDRLLKYELPEMIAIVKEIPMTSSNKTDKEKVREIMEKWLTA